MTPIQNSTIQIPFMNWEFSLSAQDKKIMAVALASIALFGFQLSLSWATTLVLTSVFTVLTYLCSREDNDWFNLNFDYKSMAFICTFLLLRPLIIYAAFWALGIPVPPLAQEGISKLILSEPWKMIPLSTILAPFSEEILFRGFLLERLEDLGLSQFMSDFTQGIIFGACHLNRAIQEGMMIPVFCMLSLMGYLCSVFKRDSQSLVSPIAIHSANNTSACLYVFLSH